MHKRKGNWQAVEECMKETQSLASRQKHLGELEQRECEEYLECEQQIRSINHRMNVAEVNTVQSVQEQKGIEKQKQAINTLTSMQGFYRVFGSIPVGRLPGTIKGPFKSTRYCLKG